MKRAPFILTLALGGVLAGCNPQSDASGDAVQHTETSEGSASELSSADLSTAERLARDLSVTQEVLTNFQGVDADLRAECKLAGGSGATCSTVRFSLLNEGPAVEAGEQAWALYFHSVRRALRLRNRADFTLEHIKGDLHRLVPAAQFAGIDSGEALQLDLLVENWLQFESDFLPRMFTVDAEGRAHVIASTDSDDLDGQIKPIGANDPDNWKRASSDANVLATAASRYSEFSGDAAGNDENRRARIIPQPLSTEVTGEPVALTTGIAVDAGPLDSRSLHAFRQRLELLQLAPSGPGAFAVKVAIDPTGIAGKISGAYQLTVEEGRAQITGFDQAGAFYGLQSLLALVDVKKRTLARVKVEDAPRFPHRGFFLDTGRNFHSKEVVLKLLDQMAAYKLNRFHFHLSDDEGWRLEIPGLPELTEIGGKRCFDLSETRCLLPQLGSGPNSDNFGSGHFSVDDYIEILRYAAARHIEVIPEFDMPAHARAAVVSMEARYRKLKDESPQAANKYRLIDPEDDTRFLSVQFYDDSYINPCVDSTYNFVGKVLSEVQAMHKTAGTPLASWHFGGDEAVNILAEGGFEAAPGKDPEKGDVPAEARREPWSQSPACQKLVADGEVESLHELGELYAMRVSKLVADAGIPTMAAWNDGVKAIENAGEELATENNYVNSWGPLAWGGGEQSAELAQAGFGLVQSHSDFLYFDMPYEVDPKENGFYWAARHTDTHKIFSYSPLNTAQMAEFSTDRDGNPWSAKAPGTEFADSVRGIQGQLWSEVVRTDEMVEYKIFPRLLALAERAWHKAEWELPLKEGQEFSADSSHVNREALAQDWHGFAAALGERELLKLDMSGIGYRIPVPGAIVEEGSLLSAQPFPGLPLEYYDGERWQPLATETPADSARALRSRSADGQRAGRSVAL